MDRLDCQVRHVERVDLCLRGVSGVRGHHPPSSPGKVGRLHVSCQLSLPFVTTVLKPNFDLKIRAEITGGRVAAN